MIVQENRSFDNLFATFPLGATRGQEKLKKGGKYFRKWVTLKATPLVLSYDLAHCRPAFLLDYDGGKMDGFNIPAAYVMWLRARRPEPSRTNMPPSPTSHPIGTSPSSGCLADAMFQTKAAAVSPRTKTCLRRHLFNHAISRIPICPKSIVDNPTFWPWGCDAGKTVFTKRSTSTVWKKGTAPTHVRTSFPTTTAIRRSARGSTVPGFRGNTTPLALTSRRSQTEAGPGADRAYRPILIVLNNSIDFYSAQRDLAVPRRARLSR